MNEDFGGPNYWSANHDQGFARGGSHYMHQGRAPQDYQPGGGAYGRGFGAAPNGPPRDYAHFASQAPYGQPSGFYHPQHQQMSRNGPTGRGGGHQRFNPNAATFTPMNFVPVQDAYSAGYSNSPVYGMSFGGPNNDPHRFYNPQSGLQAQQMPWQQQEWNEYGEEDAAYDQMYSVPEQHNRYVPTAELQQKMYESPCVGILQEIQVGLEQLITENDEYDIWAGAIKDRFVDRAITAAGQRIAVEAIMISQQGVQYSFARLLASLAKSASNLLSDAVLPTLKTFHDRRASLQPEQLTNLLLFTAECYDKLETKGGQSVDILRTALSEQVDSVLKPTSISDNVMKTVIQVIKLTGRYFDRNAEGREDMDGLLTKVNAFARGHPQLSESIKSQVSYLNELRASNWGYREKVEVQSPTSASSSGLYIGPDGKPLSEDERKFLEEHFGQLDMGEPNETNESFDEADAQEEYEDFLRQEQTRSLNKAQEQLEKLSVATNEGKQEETKQEKREEPPAADKNDATA